MTRRMSRGEERRWESGEWRGGEGALLIYTLVNMCTNMQMDGMGWDTGIPEGVDVTLIATILKYRALESQL
jgi:hypothetical protein